MGLNQPNHLVPVPSNPLQISAGPTVTSTSATDAAEPQIYFSLIIPTYNECKNVKTIIEKLSQLLDGSIPGDYELIVVDDDSPDRTWELALSLTPDYPQLRVMRREHERGLSTAVIRGWQVARGEVLGVIDADLQHPPETLLQLLAEIKRGADLAAASRHVAEGGVSDWSFVRRFLSRGAQTVGLVILPGVVGRVSDPMSGYFMVRRSCIAGKTLNPAGYKILIEVLGRGDIRWIGEVGYVFQERQEGESKVTWKQYIEYLRHLLILRLARWPMGKFLRFGVVGFSGVFVNMGVLYVLRHSLNLELTRSLIIAAELAIISNFLWNDLWTFGDISKRQPGNRQRLKRLLKFNVICLMGLIVNVLLVNLLFNVFGMNEYLANLIAIAAVTMWNFWINTKLSWRVTEVD
ncbi:MAG: glycosyltransferase [Tychonema bourrellyi B0820]|uniref:Dolichol-phosphate mannosyltransferase n=1 Tax=Tychonema bourrellyi FEM_GT703 TaxID=2040638 RepID=A0A2G4F1Z9_9CYAN|nr:glycosyltransferase [Tychonema bourrellyi]MDQ2096927.1 glycosyltransferase [Tychonema bourrellyi B0820]PHX55772.1 glycosyltransferase family 2 protein [Tychonema bourrellyi FEM_GT703]